MRGPTLPTCGASRVLRPPRPGFGASLTDDATDGIDFLVSGTSDEGAFNYRGGYWTSVAPAVRPSARYGSAMMYDPAAQEVLYFGGMNGAGPGTSTAGDHFLGDTWSFRGAWSNLTGNLSTAPGPRTFAAISYDPGSGAILLYGGLGPTGNSCRHLVVPRRGLDERLRRLPSAPAARLGSALSYDPSSARLLLFGGLTARRSRPSRSTTPGRTPMAGGPRSRRRSPPWPRGWVSATADSNAQDVVLFGGQGTFCGVAPLCPSAPSSDTWAFDNGSWVNLTSTAPPAAMTADLVYDAYLQAVLFVGATAAGAAAWWVFHRRAAARARSPRPRTR